MISLRLVWVFFLPLPFFPLLTQSDLFHLPFFLLLYIHLCICLSICRCFSQSISSVSIYLHLHCVSLLSGLTLTFVHIVFFLKLFFHRFICLHHIAGSFSLENKRPRFLMFFLLSGQLCLMSLAFLTVPTFILPLLSPFPPFFFQRPEIWLNKISDMYERPEFPIMF